MSTTVGARLKLLSGMSNATVGAMLLAIGTGATVGAVLANYSGLATGTVAQHLLVDVSSQPNLVSVRAALETALYNLSPTFDTAWENVAFAPAADTPYQQAHILFAKPDNLIFGRSWRELGFMQVKLMYPLQVGPAVTTARVEAIRGVFYKGAVLVNGSTRVVINKTPTVAKGRVEGDRYAVPIKIRFFVNDLV